MRPELIALLRLVACCVVGTGLSRLVCRGRAVLSLPESGLLSLTLCVTFAISPWLCAAWAAMAVIAGIGDAKDRNASPQLALSLLAMIAVLWVIHEAEPLLWDEHIWLLKAKLANLGTLRAASFDHRSDAIPIGYPIGIPVMYARLGGDAVALGAVLVRALCLGAFAASVLRARPESLWRVALVLVATPLILVHARAAYVDLPMGLLSAALYLELSAQRPVALRAMVLATLLATFKDEGVAHVLVIGVYTELVQPRLARRAVALALTSAGVAFVYWRVLLYLHNVIPSEHALGRPAWAHVGSIFAELFWHLSDLRSFGLLFAATVASVFAAIWVRALRRDAGTWLVLLFALLWGVIAGPDRVREFAASGTLLGRLLVQLAPLAALLVASAMQHFSAPAAPETLPLSMGIAIEGEAAVD